VEALHAQGAALPGLDVEALALQCRTMRDRNRSREAFTPSRSAATLTLFRAATDSAQHRRFFAGLAEEETWTLGWNAFADAVEVYPVPGVHATLAAEPHVRVLARCMGEALAAARQRASAARARAAAARAEQERLPALSGAA
jgi:thioesterase domain-containing protein